MKSLLCTLVLATLTTAAAKADTISITLDKPTQVATAGSTLAFYGTITNLSSATVFLNGDYFTVLGAGTLNDLGLNNVPFTLAAGANSGDIELFDVTVPANPVPATAESGSFGLTGGPDGNAVNNLGSTSFNLTPAASAPEIDPTLASSGLILVIGGIAVLRSRRTHHPA